VNSEVLKAFSKDDVVALILAQAVQIGVLTARIAELETRLDTLRKTLDNSSTLPSKGQKPNRPERPKKPRRGRPGVCPCCRKRVAAPAPERFQPGSPFGPGLCALIIHLHVTQAIGFERLVCLLSEGFGLTLSEGAIANILARAETPLLAAAAPIAAAVRESPALCSNRHRRVGGCT